MDIELLSKAGNFFNIYFVTELWAIVSNHIFDVICRDKYFNVLGIE